MKIYTPTDELPRLAESSTPEQWSTAGRMLFERKLYSAARNCFHRASLPREEAIANAYELRDEAERAPFGQSGTVAEVRRRDAFIRAAKAFLLCAEEYNKPVYFCRAAECFEETKEDIIAAETYYRGGDFTKTILVYCRLRMYDEATVILQDKRECVRQDMGGSLVEGARLHYLKRIAKDSEFVVSLSKLTNNVF